MYRNDHGLVTTSVARLDFLLALAQYGGRCGRRALVREFGDGAVARHLNALTKLGFVQNERGRLLILTTRGRLAVRRILKPLVGDAGPKVCPSAMRQALRLASETFVETEAESR
jgi:hypothetical protein